MKGAPPTAHEALEKIDAIVRTVDQRGREMDERWGLGRLPTLVPLEWAERFRNQHRKFSGAIWEYDFTQAQTHGEAMLRAYAKLDELATAIHGEPTKLEQWEFTITDGEDLIILVRDIKDVGRVDTGGRQCQVWSLDEIASVIRNHPALAKAKDVFPGAVVESVRPAKASRDKLNDELTQAPFV